MNPVIFLDALATAPMLPQVAEIMRHALENQFEVPTGAYSGARRAREALALARHHCAEFLGVKREEVIFTNSGAEACNIALGGVDSWLRARGKTSVVVGAAEHPVVLLCARRLAERLGGECRLVPVNAKGRVSLSDLGGLLDDSVGLVAMQAANHEIGTVQDAVSAAVLAHDVDALFLCDATAAAGWLPLKECCAGADMTLYSSHRFGGPKGVGVLQVRSGIKLQPLLLGGSQENGLRPGALNLPAILGMGEVCRLHLGGLEEKVSGVRQWQLALHSFLCSAVPSLTLNGAEIGQARLPHNLHYWSEAVEGEALALMCDAQGVAIGAGPGCVISGEKLTPTMKALGWDRARARRSFWLGLHPRLSTQEVLGAATVIAQGIAKARSLSPTWQERVSPGNGV